MASLRRVRPWERGYVRGQVDSYLAEAVAALADGVPASFTPGAIRRAGFDFCWGGYDVGTVDRYLDGLEQRSVSVRIAGHEPRLLHAQLHADLEDVRAALAGADGANGRRFVRVAPVATGYDFDEVDRLADRLLAQLDEQPTTPLDPDDIRFAVFRRSRGGYDEDAVDDVLDAVIDVALRQRVLAEASGAPETSPGADAGGGHDAGTMSAHEGSVAAQDAPAGP